MTDEPFRQPHKGGPYGAIVSEACRGLWLGVIWRAILDLQPGWDVSKEAHREARAWFEGPTRAHRAAFTDVCAMASVDEGALLSLYRSGRLHELAAEAVGRERWNTRRANILARGQTKPGQQIGFGF